MLINILENQNIVIMYYTLGHQIQTALVQKKEKKYYKILFLYEIYMKNYAVHHLD